MAEEKAKALGHEPLAYIRSYAVSAVDPGWQLLMGPVFAVPKALERAELTWSELGLVEIHEAFAAQVLSNVQAWGSQAWAERLGLAGPVGEVDWERTNVIGRVHRHRASVRRHRRAAGHHPGQRDAPARRAVRADLDLCAGRDGVCDGVGAGMMAESASLGVGSREPQALRLKLPATRPAPSGLHHHRSKTASRSSPSTSPASRSTSSARGEDGDGGAAGPPAGGRR